MGLDRVQILNPLSWTLSCSGHLIWLIPSDSEEFQLISQAFKETFRALIYFEWPVKLHIILLENVVKNSYRELEYFLGVRINDLVMIQQWEK